MQLKRIFTGEQVCCGQRPRWWWGISYRPMGDLYVLHPIPLNWIVRGVRSLWLKLQFPKPTRFEREISRAHLEGKREACEGIRERVDRAVRAGFRSGWNTYAEQAAKTYAEEFPAAQPLEIRLVPQSYVETGRILKMEVKTPCS